ncbi:MAG: DUF6359 domain-containing protein [Prevotellaceae bacterium]|nr:DUF6359 domain-containing protein [Prevotellaceae bacterium]
MPKALLITAIVTLCLLGCEKVDLDDDGTSVGASSQTEPIGHGLGTQDCPLTPDEMLDGVMPQSTSDCWVMGYAVGSTYRTLSNAVFGVPTTYSTNILLASDSLCEDVSKCIAAELSSTTMKNKFSLSLCPEEVRQFVVLEGTYGTYFSQTGLRTVSGGYWLPGFNLSLICPAPQEWEEEYYYYGEDYSY